MKTHYEVLGVAQDASPKQIRDAYRRLAHRYHPDHNQGDPEAGERYLELVAAHAVLADAKQRQEYDQSLRPITTIQDHFARDPSGRKVLSTMLEVARAAPQPGMDLTMRLEVAPAVLKKGGKIELLAPPGSVADGKTIEVILPGGQAAHSWYRVEHLGTAGRNGAENGHLWLVLIPTSKRKVSQVGARR